MIKEKSSRERLIEQNIGLVHACAGRFRGRGVEYEDLFQAGCVGLCKAADGFDPEKGFAFSTYAVPTILGEIRRVFRDGGTVKVGRSLKEKARRVLGIQQSLTVSLGREPSIYELSEQIGTDPAETAFLLNAALPAVSLTMDSEDEQTQVDIPVDSPDTEIEDKMSLYTVLGSLSEADRTLIELRFFKGLTQCKTAEMMNISQVQVSRKERAILSRMRQEMLR